MNLSTVLRALCIAVVLAPAAQARALAAPAPSPSPVPPVIQRVVTSDRGSESAARTARTTYVVTAAQIARDGDRTIADALANVPGVNLVRYGGFGSEVSAGIRGSSPQQVLVLMNGLPVAGAQIDNIDLEDIPVAGVSRIEVVEGGGSTLYGSGSIGGVINIVTADRTTRSSATLATGSFGEQTYLVSTPFVSFQRTYATNNYSVVGGTPRQNAQAGLTAVNLHYRHTVGAFDFALTGDLSNARLGVPGELDFFSPTSTQTTVARDAQLSVRHRTRRATFTVSLGAGSQDLGFTCNTPVDASCPNAYPTPPPPATANAPYAELLYDQRWMASLRNEVTSAHQRLVYGLDLARGIARVDAGTPATPSGADVPTTIDPYAQTAAYLQSQWFNAAGDEFYAGLRGERDGALGGAYSPSLGGIVRFNPSVALRLNAGTAFRAPTAEDLYYPGFSNPKLVAERTQVGDLSLDFPALLGGASLTWFTTAGSNFIVSYPPDYIPENVGHALIQGASLVLHSTVRHGYRATFNLTDLYRAQNLDTGARLPGRGAVFAGALTLAYQAPPASRFDGYGVTLATSGPQESADPYLPSIYGVYQPRAYTTLDAYAGYRVTPKLTLAVRGYNLGNTRYAIYAGYPMPGRAFAVELRTR